MDAFNDHSVTGLPTPRPALPSVPNRHYLRSWSSPAKLMKLPSARRPELADTPAGKPAAGAVATWPGLRRLDAGQAVKLRATTLSVLRIAHGRVWVTLSDAGPFSRVLAGDHFLSRGESLTLLPGQELVMEPFGRGDMTSARFSWGAPADVTAMAAVAPLLRPAHWRAGVMQPLLDLRQAGGLAARAMGRLVLGLGHAARAEMERLTNYVAMIFVAGSAEESGAGSTFGAVSRPSAAGCRLV